MLNLVDLYKLTKAIKPFKKNNLQNVSSDSVINLPEFKVDNSSLKDIEKLHAQAESIESYFHKTAKSYHHDGLELYFEETTLDFIIEVGSKRDELAQHLRKKLKINIDEYGSFIRIKKDDLMNSNLSLLTIEEIQQTNLDIHLNYIKTTDGLITIEDSSSEELSTKDFVSVDNTPITPDEKNPEPKLFTVKKFETDKIKIRFIEEATDLNVDLNFLTEYKEMLKEKFQQAAEPFETQEAGKIEIDICLEINKDKELQTTKLQTTISGDLLAMFDCGEILGKKGTRSDINNKSTYTITQAINEPSIPREVVKNTGRQIRSKDKFYSGQSGDNYSLTYFQHNNTQNNIQETTYFKQFINENELCGKIDKNGNYHITGQKLKFFCELFNDTLKNIKSAEVYAKIENGEAIILADWVKLFEEVNQPGNLIQRNIDNFFGDNSSTKSLFQQLLDNKDLFFRKEENGDYHITSDNSGALEDLCTKFTTPFVNKGFYDKWPEIKDKKVIILADWVESYEELNKLTNSKSFIY